MLDRLFGRGRHAGKRKPLQSEKRTRQKPAGTHTFVVQKAYCTPARDLIYTAFEPRGVEILHYSETVRTSGKLPIAQEARVTVRFSQANWAEYLMERTQKLAIVSGGIDPRNQTWAAKYGGKLPTPWIERGCEDGERAWREVARKAD